MAGHRRRPVRRPRPGRGSGAGRAGHDRLAHPSAGRGTLVRARPGGGARPRVRLPAAVRRDRRVGRADGSHDRAPGRVGPRVRVKPGPPGRPAWLRGRGTRLRPARRHRPRRAAGGAARCGVRPAAARQPGRGQQAPGVPEGHAAVRLRPGPAAGLGLLRALRGRHRRAAADRLPGGPVRRRDPRRGQGDSRGPGQGLAHRSRGGGAAAPGGLPQRARAGREGAGQARSRAAADHAAAPAVRDRPTGRSRWPRSRAPTARSMSRPPSRSSARSPPSRPRRASG